MELHIKGNQSDTKDAVDLTFITDGDAGELHQVLYYPSPGEVPYLVDITGWENGKAVPAKAQKVLTGDDGESWLVYGGADGLRLKKHEGIHHRNFENVDWSELYLLYDADNYTLAIEPYLIDPDGSVHQSWLRRKISWLKASALSLLKTGITPGRLALGLTIGIIIGTFPLLGTHTIMGIALALVFRLNQVAVNLGVWASMPLYVSILYPSLRLGEKMLGVSPLEWNQFYNDFTSIMSGWQFFKDTLTKYSISLIHLHLGWLLITVLWALPMYYIIYILLKQLEKRKSHKAASRS